jgi:hypothetical protein
MWFSGLWEGSSRYASSNEGGASVGSKGSGFAAFGRSSKMGEELREEVGESRYGS